MPYDRVCPVCGEELPSYPFENHDINDCCIDYLLHEPMDGDEYDYYSIEQEELNFNDDDGE